MIISVGGEGTANEVVNGIYQSKKLVKYGFIRSGTVNDYLRTINWPESLEDQVEIINRQEYRSTPLVLATGDNQEKVGLNIADIGVGASIAYMASVQRKLTWIRGALRYQLLSIRALLGWKNIPATITIDDEIYEGDLSLLTAGFSKYSGAYFLHPHAEVFGDKMAYTFVMNYSKLNMMSKMKMLERGEHTPEMENIYMDYANEIKIESDMKMLFEVDGEPFTKRATNVTFRSLPNAIEILKND